MGVYMGMAAFGGMGGRPRTPSENRQQGERPGLFKTLMGGRKRAVQAMPAARPAQAFARDMPIARGFPTRPVYSRAYAQARAQRGAEPEMARVRTDLQRLQQTVGAQQRQLAAWNQWASYEARMNAAEQAARANALATKPKVSKGKRLMTEIFGEELQR